MHVKAALEHSNEFAREPIELSDKTLISASRIGDQGAFEELYRRYKVGIRDLCQRLLGDHMRAEDVTQETFIRAYMNMNRFEEGKSLWPWLSTIAHHLCIDEIRGLRRGPIVIEQGGLRAKGAIEGDLTSDTVITRSEQNQLRTRLSTALANLSPADRRIVFLRSAQEWTYEDIARLEGRTVDAIRNVAWRARIALRALLTQGESAERVASGLIPGLVLTARVVLERFWVRMNEIMNGWVTLATGSHVIGEQATIAILVASISLSWLTPYLTLVESWKTAAVMHDSTIKINTDLPILPSDQEQNFEEYPDAEATIKMKGKKPRRQHLLSDEERIAVHVFYTNPQTGERDRFGILSLRWKCGRDTDLLPSNDLVKGSC